MDNFIPIIKYCWQTCRHKWYVFRGGLRTKAPIYLLLIHDWSKFSPSELPYYGKQFFGRADDPMGFVKCWTHHQNHNPHHWEYWIPRTGHTRCTPPIEGNQPLPMPEKYVREMLADWLGAGRAYENKWPDVWNWSWLIKNRPNMLLHQETEKLIDKILMELMDNSTSYGKLTENN